MLRLLRVTVVIAAVFASFQLGLDASNRAQAQDVCPNCQPHHFGSNLGVGTTPVPRGPEYGQPDLFYNFYVPPTAGGVGAQMYLAPGPVPPHVGHTYYTYQPFMPHELLYKHKRTYHRYYNEGRGLTRTSIRWR